MRRAFTSRRLEVTRINKLYQRRKNNEIEKDIQDTSDTHQDHIDIILVCNIQIPDGILSESSDNTSLTFPQLPNRINNSNSNSNMFISDIPSRFSFFSAFLLIFRVCCHILSPLSTIQLQRHNHSIWFIRVRGVSRSRTRGHSQHNQL